VVTGFIVDKAVGAWDRPFASERQRYLLSDLFRREGGWSWYKLPGPGHPAGGAGWTVLHMSLSVVSLFVVCTNEPFQTKPKSHCSWEALLELL